MGIEDDISELRNKLSKIERMLLSQMTAEQIIQADDYETTESWIRLNS